MAHRVLGDGSDGERRVYTGIGRHGGAIADEQVLIAEDAVVPVDHTGRDIAADDRTAEDVRRRRNVGDRLQHHALRDAAGMRSKPRRGLVSDLDERWVWLLRILLGDESNAPEPAPLRSERDGIVEALHHE